MVLSKKNIILAALVGFGLAGVLAYPRLNQAWRLRQEEKRWHPWLVETFSGNQTQHSQSWDELVRPLEQGGFAPRAWGHFTLKGFPHQAFRARAWLHVANSDQAAWLKIIDGSPVEYYDRTDGVSTGIPRSRYAGSFGRIDLIQDQGTLSAGQEDLKGRLLNVAAQALTQSVGASDFMVEWSSQGERLQLNALGSRVQSLARELFLGSTPELKIGLAGENVILTRLEVSTLKNPGAIAQEKIADDYFVVGKAHMAEPIYNELASESENPADRGRYVLRRAQALALQGKQPEAEEALKVLIGREPKGLYGGYARMDLVALQLADGKSAADLSPALVALYTEQPGHPMAGAARLLQARWLAQGKVTGDLVQAQDLALGALQAGDPAVATEALEFLSNSPTAMASSALLLKLLEIRHSRLGENVVLSEVICLKQVDLQCQLKDWAGLGKSLVDSMNLPSVTRIRLYQLAEAALLKGHELSGPQLWQSLALEGRVGAFVLLDFLRLRGYGFYRGPEKQNDFPWPILAATDAVRAQVTSAKGALAAQAERTFADFQKAPLPVSYGHLPQQGPSIQGQDLCLLYKSGEYWGCGLSIEPSQEPLLAGGQIDLSGYRMLKAELWAPKGTEVYLSISEDGVADPKSDHFDGLNKADGEQYLFPSQVGTGEWQNLELNLSTLAPAPNWGNPRGNLTVDLQAVKKMDLSIPGRQGSGRICVRNIRFTVN